MGSDVGYGLRKLLAADDMGYILGVCLRKFKNNLDIMSHNYIKVI